MSCKKLKCLILQCCKILREEIENRLPCPPIVINQLPFTISQSGEYILCQNLIYDGNLPPININSPDIFINLNRHSITTTNSALATVIDILAGSNNVEIGNGSLLGNAARGIRIAASNKIVINNLYSSGFIRHIQPNGIINSLSVINSTFINTITDVLNVITSGIIQFNRISNTIIEKCRFDGFTFGINTNFGSTNLTIKETQFTNNIFGLRFDANSIPSSNLLLEACQFTAHPLTNFNCVQIGSLGTRYSSTIIIRKCNFDTTASLGFQGQPGIDAITLFNSQTSNSVIIEDNTFIGAGSTFSAIRLGDFASPVPPPFPFPANSTIIRGNTVDSVSGPLGSQSLIGFACLNGSAARIEKNLIRNTTLAGILVRDMFTFAHIIDNSIVTGLGDGILVESQATGAAIIDNIIQDHCGAGIRLELGSFDNLVQDNKIFKNGSGIDDNGTNEIGVNTVFSNNKICPPISINENLLQKFQLEKKTLVVDLTI